MSEHLTPRPNVVRQCDVAIVGGSAAGLAAALQLAQQRRSVLVVDSGTPRNERSAHLHGYLGFDGAEPAELARVARADVRGYGVEVLAGSVLDVRRADDEFSLELTGGHEIRARRVLLATGIVDDLPDIDGIAEHWGGAVAHCPFCHGYDARDRRIVQIVTSTTASHATPLLHRLTSDLTVVLDGVDPTADAVAEVGPAGISAVSATPVRVLDDVDGALCGVELDDGSVLDADVVFVSTRVRPRLDAVNGLGVRTEAHPSGLGEFVPTGPTGETEARGVYAAGNMTDPSHQLLHAAADGSRVGAMICYDLAREEMENPALARSSAARDWDRRYSSDPVWSGNPNGALVREISHLPPGRALDVGAGEGGDAVWLAEQGWEVTAADLSERALARVARAAEDRGLALACLHADANGPDPFEPGAFDLVTAHYASIPRTPDRRGARNLVAAVAPGGTLLVVNHDPTPMRAPIDVGQHSRAFDVDAYLSTDEIAAILTNHDDWKIEVHDTRARPPGAASAAHHVDDVVLRAVRSKN